MRLAKLPSLLILPALLLLAAASPAVTPKRTPAPAGPAAGRPRTDTSDFEAGADSNRTWPAGWVRSGNQPAGSIELVSSGHGGERAVRLSSTGTKGYVGLMRTLPDSLRTGAVAVRLSAWIRTEGASSTSMWIRLNAYSRVILSPDSLVQWPKGDTGWTHYEFIVPVLPEMEHVTCGVRLTGGKLWMDDVRVELLTPEQEPQSTPKALAYLDAALDSLCRRTVLTSQLNWGVLKRAAKTQMIGGKVPADTWEALRYAILRLDPDGEVRKPEKPGLVGERTNYALLNALDDSSRVAMIRMPKCNSEDRATQLAFADTTRSVIRRMTAKHVRGWMIDLRVVEGGELMPGLAGLGPLLGNGRMVGWVRPDGVRGWWTHRQGLVESEPCTPPECTLVTVIAPELVDTTTTVAVLIGPRTSGAGEGLALAFRNRPHTRMFGEPTAGRAYARERIRLSDGAQMRFASAVLTDAHGRRQDEAIMADDSLGAALLTGGMDSLMTVALEWLKEPRSRGPNPR